MTEARRWRKRKRGPPEKTDSLSQRNGTSSWAIQQMYGGKFYGRAFFSKDERYILPQLSKLTSRYFFAVTEKCVKVFSSKTGKLVRSFGWMQDGSKITDLILDPSDDFRVIAISNDKTVRLYNWTDGLPIAVRIVKALDPLTTFRAITLLRFHNSFCP